LIVNPWWYLTASFDVHFETLGLPLLVLSAYSLWRGRPRTAIVAALIALLFGDVVAVGALCVGIAGLVSRHARRASGWRAPLAVAGLAAAWVLLATVLGANKGSGIVTNYGYLVGASPGASSGWVVGHLLLHPFHVLHALVDRIGGIGRVVASAGLVGVATPWGFFVALGTLGPTALNANKAFLSPTIAFQTVAVIPFVFVGSVMLLLRIARPVPAALEPAAPDLQLARQATPATTRRWRTALAATLAVALVTVALVQSAPLYRTIRADWWRVDAKSAAALATAASRVPPDAEAVVSQGVIGRFAGRGELYPLLAAPQRFPVRARQVDFVIVPSAGIESIPAASAEAVRASLVEHERASVVFDENGVTVLSWRPPPGITSIVLP
jgi:hypothetical protein